MSDVQAGSPGPQEPLAPAADENFVALAGASRDLVCVATLGGRVRLLNPAGRACLGLGDAAAGFAALAEYVHLDDRVLASRLIADVITKAVVERSQIRFTHQQTGADVVLSCHLFPLKRWHAGDPLAAAIVGRHRQAVEPDAKTAATTAGANRLSEMFTGIVGHDLRNPLNAILTSAHVLMRQIQDADAQGVVSRIVSSGHRMQRMIDQLLDLTRVRVGTGIPLHPVSVDVAAIARAAGAELAAANPQWTIDVQASGNTVGLWDGDRVAQMISNLLGNAVQHGAADAGIAVAIDGTTAHEVTVSVHNGGAIPAELLPILFNPFRVVHQKRHRSGGLGLGLDVPRQIALAHGGDVTVTSSAETGTTFVVRLPRAHPGAQPAASLSGLGEDDMAVLEMLATAPRATSVTAQLFGAVALHERAPREYWRIFERYVRLLDLALDQQTYKNAPPGLSEELRAIADALGLLGAGAREVAELHARALRQRTRGVTMAKAQALTAEGRLVSFELMGHLLSYYRRRSGLGGDS